MPHLAAALATSPVPALDDASPWMMSSQPSPLTSATARPDVPELAGRSSRRHFPARAACRGSTRRGPAAPSGSSGAPSTRSRLPSPLTSPVAQPVAEADERRPAGGTSWASLGRRPSGPPNTIWRSARAGGRGRPRRARRGRGRRIRPCSCPPPTIRLPKRPSPEPEPRVAARRFARPPRSPASRPVDHRHGSRPGTLIARSARPSRLKSPLATSPAELHVGRCTGRADRRRLRDHG